MFNSLVSRNRFKPGALSLAFSSGGRDWKESSGARRAGNSLTKEAPELNGSSKIWYSVHGVAKSWTQLIWISYLGFPWGSAGKESTCNMGHLGSIPGLGNSLGEGNGYPLQYSDQNMTEQLSHTMISHCIMTNIWQCVCIHKRKFFIWCINGDDDLQWSCNFNTQNEVEPTENFLLPHWVKEKKRKEKKRKEISWT